MNQSNDVFFLLLDNSPNPVFVCGAGKFRYLNPPALKLFGAESAHLLLGKPVAERFPADGRDAVEAFFSDTESSADTPLQGLEVCLKLDGAPVAVDISQMSFRFKGESAILVFMRDISLRKHAEAELRQNQQLLQSIIDNTAAVIFVKDVAGRYLLVNRRYGELFHIDIDAVVGRTDHDLFEASVADAIVAADRQVLAAHRAMEFEEMVPVDGGVHTYLALKYPLCDAAGQVYAVCGIASDITERKQAEARNRALSLSLEQRINERTKELESHKVQLQEALALNRNILLSSTVGIAAYDQDGCCVLVNPAFCQIVGGDEAQMLKQNFRQIHSWTVSGMREMAEQVLAGGAALERELYITTSFGRTLCLQCHLSRFASQERCHLLLMVLDVTAAKQAQEALRERERSFRTLADNVPDNISRYDTQGRVTYVNRALSQTLGRPASELVGSRLGAEVFGPLWHAVRQVVASGEGTELELNVAAQDGSTRYHVLRLAPELGADGKTVSVLAVGRDLTRQKLVEQELRLAASVFHNSAEGVMIAGADGCILSVNPAFTEITGYSEAEARGNKPSMLRSDRHDAQFYQTMWGALGREGRWQGEIWNRRKGGEAYLEWLTINRIDDSAGVPLRYVAVFHDITDLRRKDERILHLAFHDALTGLPNRALMQDRLQHSLERAKRENSRMVVMFIDLDRFKAINDSLGHDVGDLLLQEVASRIVGRTRAMDTVARLGGDEFLVLMEDIIETGDCVSLAEDLIAAVAQPMKLRDQNVEIGASIGMAFFPEDGADSLGLMKCADMAMYAAKAAGRNTYRFFKQEMLDKASRRLALEMDLRLAVAHHELELHYQPKLSLVTGKAMGVEALVRWRHPVRGFLPPSDFIPLAEESGLIVELGSWVLEQACRQAAAWQSRGLPVNIAVNVSAKQLEKGDLAQRIADLAACHGISPSLLEVELTESAVMADPENVIGLFARLRRIGVTIAVDDFGTGYSSLAYLRRLPIDVIKIDRSFVAEVECDKDDAQIVKTILALGQTLKLTVVVEGIESESQAEILRGFGCDLAQGFHYSRPLPAEAVETWLRQRNLDYGCVADLTQDATI